MSARRSVPMATRRAVLLQAWRAAKMRIEREGIAQLSAEEEAGRLLARWTSANAAHALCLLESAKTLLAEVVVEEGGTVRGPGRNAS